MEKQVKTKVWEQQPKESDPAYAAFSIYRDMGKNRTVAAVVRECGKNRSLIDRWHKGHNWAARCRAYDNSIDEEARKKAAVEAANIRKTHLQIAAQLQLKALNALNLLAPEDMTPRDIKEMLKLALEVENNLVLEKAPQEDATAAPTLMQTIGVRYAEDVKESDEANVEYNRMAQIIELLNTEQDTKEVFEDLIEARETYGVAYLEVIRNMNGEVQQIEFLHDTPSIRMTVPLEPRIETTYFNRGEAVQRKKKFRKFRQQLGGETVYFKEFGDPRRMDWRDGHYLEDGEVLDIAYEANEILDFSIGIQPYGEVRWIGQVLGVDGSRRAERLNNNYFINGRHAKEEADRLRKISTMMATLKQAADLAGLEVVGRVVFRDKSTGKEYR